MNSDNLNAELENGFSLYEQLEDKKLSIPKRSEFGKLPPLVEQFIQQFGNALFTRCEMDRQGLPYSPDVISFFNTFFPVETGPKNDRRLCPMLGEAKFREWIISKILNYSGALTYFDLNDLNDRSTVELTHFLYRVSLMPYQHLDRTDRTNTAILDLYLGLMGERQYNYVPLTLEADATLLLDHCDALAVEWYQTIFGIDISTNLIEQEMQSYVAVRIEQETQRLYKEDWEEKKRLYQDKTVHEIKPILSAPPIQTNCLDTVLIEAINRYNSAVENINRIDEIVEKSYMTQPISDWILGAISDLAIGTSVVAILAGVAFAAGFAAVTPLLVTTITLWSTGFLVAGIFANANNSFAYWERGETELADTYRQRAVNDAFLFAFFKVVSKLSATIRPGMTNQRADRAERRATEVLQAILSAGADFSSVATDRLMTPISSADKLEEKARAFSIDAYNEENLYRKIESYQLALKFLREAKAIVIVYSFGRDEERILRLENLERYIEENLNKAIEEKTKQLDLF